MGRFQYGARLVAALVAFVLVVGACGGGDDRAELPPLRAPDSNTNGADRATSSDRSDATKVAEPDQPMCAVFEEIIRLDEAVEGQLESGIRRIDQAVARGDRAAAEAAVHDMVHKLRSALDENVADLIGVYDELIVLAPHLEDDVVLVRDFTYEVTHQLATGDGSLDHFIEVFSSEAFMAEGTAAGHATLRINEVSEAECGLTIAS